MHFIYRSKKQALPLVNDPKLAAYYPQIHHSPTNTYFSRKKSIDVILEKHKAHNATINDQILIYQKPLRKTYRPSKTRKPDSGYLKHPHPYPHPHDHDLSHPKLDSKLLTRNRSTEINEKTDAFWPQRRKGESEYSPYLMGQSKKTRSNSKLRGQL
jgi:hypothetical protein